MTEATVYRVCMANEAARNKEIVRGRLREEFADCVIDRFCSSTTGLIFFQQNVLLKSEPLPRFDPQIRVFLASSEASLSI